MTETFVIPTGCEARVVYSAGAAASPETAPERVVRLYAAKGGPLLGWLQDERVRRGQTLREMADELGVSCSYVHQLRTGARQTPHISPEVAKACAAYLCVPPIVVKMLSGAVKVADFVWPHQSDEAVIDRALNAMKTDPVAQWLLPPNLSDLPLDAKRSLVLMYAESSRQDVLGVRTLPDVLQSLQRAAVIHDENTLREVQ